MKARTLTYVVFMVAGIGIGLLMGLHFAGTGDFESTAGAEGSMIRQDIRDPGALELQEKLRRSPVMIDPFHEYLFTTVAGIEPDPVIQAQIESLLSEVSRLFGSGRTECEYCH